MGSMMVYGSLQAEYTGTKHNAHIHRYGTPKGHSAIASSFNHCVTGLYPTDGDVHLTASVC